jgi:NodT family efflux transporter outer membrane factor (OMF) lipoprotein
MGNFMTFGTPETRAILVGAVLALVLFGCKAVGPDYSPPVSTVPDDWHQTVAKELTAEEPQLLSWWNQLNDPVLNDLIRRARENNLTVKQTDSVIRETRARRGITSRRLQPTIDTNLSYTRARPSEQVPPLSLLPEDLGVEAKGSNVFAGSFDVAWEADVFGGIRRSIEAADAAIDASIELRRDVLVTLLAEVALNYLEVRTLQQRIFFAESNIDLQEQTLDLARNRFESGIAGKLDPAQAESNLANTEAVLPTLRQALHATLNRLAVLLAQHPGTLTELMEVQPIPEPPASIAVGIPADVIRQRPDIRLAERQLAGQTARVGVATANLYPKFGLFGSFGIGTSDLGNLGGSVTGFVTPLMSWNLFNRGRIKDQITVEEELTEQAFLGYENTLLAALAEVETSMIALREEEIRMAALKRAVDASLQAVELVGILYDAGLTDFQNVLDTQRVLFIQQDQVVASEGQVTKNLISLYKALGGGWQSAPPPTAGP